MQTSFLAWLLVTGAAAQTFEVASVKISDPPAGTQRMMVTTKGGPGSDDPGQITWSNLAMRGVVLRAYGIRNHQLTAPKWIDDVQYDITAKIPQGATQEQFRSMLRNLLKERFRMEAHEEIREAPIYALLTGRGAPKLEASKQATAPPAAAPPADPRGGIRLDNGFPRLPPGPGMTVILLNGNVRLSAQAQGMAQLAEHLSTQLDREVTDLTGLNGLYDFHLSYMPDSTRAYLSPDAEPRPDAPADVFTALGQQLGLKLEARKGPVKMVFIDSMEKVPTGN